MPYKHADTHIHIHSCLILLRFFSVDHLHPCWDLRGTRVSVQEASPHRVQTPQVSLPRRFDPVIAHTCIDGIQGQSVFFFCQYLLTKHLLLLALSHGGDGGGGAVEQWRNPLGWDHSLTFSDALCSCKLAASSRPERARGDDNDGGERAGAGAAVSK